MPDNNETKLIVFVHGWSVTSTDTYGELPARLVNEAAGHGVDIQIEEIFLGKYISFHDEVTVDDIARAFQSALIDQLGSYLHDNRKFICITHSTGGPVVRVWLDRYYKRQNKTCPLSHLIMLAPANFGSALAKLGKSKLSRIKSWFSGVEPGQGVLNWLELGSSSAWDLNHTWILDQNLISGSDEIFPFVLTGDYIDRKLYDHLNSYTGELGSDGVVRAASANLNSTFIKLIQQKPVFSATGKLSADTLNVDQIRQSQEIAFRIIPKKSHSGKDMGIMRSVKATSDDVSNSELINSIFRAIKVTSQSEYHSMVNEFIGETETVQNNGLVEKTKFDGLPARYFIHDKFVMVIFKLVDTEGNPVNDYDLYLTAGKQSNPNFLPEGFFVDRQQNSISSNIVTYFINYNIMSGYPAVVNQDKDVIRAEQTGISSLGFKIVARPDSGFVRYLPCEIKATADMLKQAIKPNSTTIIEIVLQRVLYKSIFRLKQLAKNYQNENFEKIQPGNEVV